MDDREQSVQHFLDLIKRSHRGKFKIYIGMIAGVGKSYRMLQEAHELLENGVDVQIGYVETHGRVGTEAMLQGLPVISRRKIFYKGKELEEMDLDTIIRIHPEIVIVDELARNCIYKGFWQSEKYFRHCEDDIRKQFTFCLLMN